MHDVERKSREFCVPKPNKENVSRIFTVQNAVKRSTETKT